MADRGDFRVELRALDEHRSARVIPSGMHERAHTRLRAAAGRRSGAPRIRRAAILAFAAGSAAVLAFVALTQGPSQTQVPRSEAAPDRWVVSEGLVLVAEGCELTRAGEDQTLIPSACDLRGEGLTLRSSGALRLAVDAGSVRVVDGDVLVSVDPRPGDPLRIAVSHGIIEVIGTRFLIHQGPDEGRVDLLEGHIVFHADGVEVGLAAGEHLRWPLVPEDHTGPSESSSAGGEVPLALVEPKAASSQRRHTHSDHNARTAEIAELSARVTGLRNRGAHLEAIEVLERALSERGWPVRTRELWSFELGSLLATKLDDSAAACLHWREHQRHFPAGRHAEAVRRSQQRLDCE